MDHNKRPYLEAIEDSKTEIEVTLREMHLSILEKVLAYDPSAAMQIRGATTASGEDEEEGGNGGSGGEGASLGIKSTTGLRQIQDADRNPSQSSPPHHQRGGWGGEV